jgi:hypothetical protein
MMDFHNVFSRNVPPPPAASMDIPRNWRSELGTFWKDIEEAGSVTKAIRLRTPAAAMRTNIDAVEGPGESAGSSKADRWGLFRTLCFSIL